MVKRFRFPVDIEFPGNDDLLKEMKFRDLICRGEEGEEEDEDEARERREGNDVAKELLLIADERTENFIVATFMDFFWIESN